MTLPHSWTEFLCGVFAFYLPLWRGIGKKPEGPLSCVYVCGGKHSEGTLLPLCIFSNFVPSVLVLTRAHNPSMMDA